MSASLPAGAQWESLMPISCPWNTGRPWWPLWVISAIALPGRSSRKTSNALRLVFGPRTWSSPLSMIRSICSWSRSPLAPTSEKPAAKTTANFAFAATASRRIGSGSPTRIATRSSCSSMSVRVLAQGRPATSARLGLTKCTAAPRSSAHSVIFWVSAVLGRALLSEAPTTATLLGRKNVSRSMERRVVGRPVMSFPSLPAVVSVAMSLPRAAPPCPRRPCRRPVQPDSRGRPTPGLWRSAAGPRRARGGTHRI